MNTALASEPRSCDWPSVSDKLRQNDWKNLFSRKDEPRRRLYKVCRLFITSKDEVTPGRSFNPLLISFIKSGPISDKRLEAHEFEKFSFFGDSYRLSVSAYFIISPELFVWIISAHWIQSPLDLNLMGSSESNKFSINRNRLNKAHTTMKSTQTAASAQHPLNSLRLYGSGGSHVY